MIDDVRGMSFPFRIDPETGGVASSSGPDKIRQNVRLIVGTRVGERPMLRDFGSKIHALVHDPNDGVLADLARNHIQQALLQWETRIVVTSARVEQAEGEMRLRITYAHADEPVSNELIIPLR